MLAAMWATCKGMIQSRGVANSISGAAVPAGPDSCAETAAAGRLTSRPRQMSIGSKMRWWIGMVDSSVEQMRET